MQNLQTLSDRQLSEIARCGDRAAFGVLAERHYRRAMGLAFGVMRNRHDAEDHVQSALHKALAHIHELRTVEHFGTWLGRIVINECYMAVRQKDRTAFTQFDETASQGNGPDPQSAEADIMIAEIVRLVREEAKTIQPFLRDTVLLADVEELPLQEVASKLGISISAAKSRLHRARRMLRERLRRSGVHTPRPGTPPPARYH